MNKTIILSALAAGLGLAVVPASAATIVNCGSTTGDCIDTDENVNLPNGTNQTSVTGLTNQTQVRVFFTSAGNRLDSANGAASIDAFDDVLENLTFTLLDGATFQTAQFTLSALTGQLNSFNATSVFFQFSDGTSQTIGSLSGNGNYKFGASGGGLTSITLTGQPAGRGFDSFRQLKLGGVSAVPEPTTWAMMLAGFGAVGYSMRRRKVAHGVRQLV